MTTQPLVEKYNVAAPRYTSYPTVPFWNTATFSEQAWRKSILQAQQDEPTGGVSLYVHLPYCESMCTFCACHKRITHNHGVEEPYIEAVLNEWRIYRQLFKRTPHIAELHLGGGTPTFFSPQNLQKLVEGLLAGASIAANAEFSFEGHPQSTTEEHLKVLYELGFRRVSFGVQDYDPIVQLAIKRIQTPQQVAKITAKARQIGYTSVSHDLVVGLPFQTAEGFQNTIKTTLALRPDRLSLYSYAHVPWLKGNGQRGFDENNLPTASQKRTFYEMARQTFEQAGYREIGMDHFALPNDRLFEALENRCLHRNFMGYTPQPTRLLIGLGVSSIGDSWRVFAQNTKDVDEYIHLTKQGILPLLKGHVLSDTDLKIRQMILDLMCLFETHWTPEIFSEKQRSIIFDQLRQFAADGLLVFDDTSLRILSQGRPFVRNISMIFDEYLANGEAPHERVFSKAI
ncbi:MAG: oxygen-independent coproporphyrinogen III oxidase [Runella sp.]